MLAGVLAVSNLIGSSRSQLHCGDALTKVLF